MSFDFPPWNPERDPVLLALLGKFIEECSEASHMAAQCIIQGIGEVEPVTQAPNRVELEKEIADVLATTELLIINLRMDRAVLENRKRSKMLHLGGWHHRLRNSRIPDCVCRTSSCGHPASSHVGQDGACIVCKKICWQ